MALQSCNRTSHKFLKGSPCAFVESRRQKHTCTHTTGHWGSAHKAFGMIRRDVLVAFLDEEQQMWKKESGAGCVWTVCPQIRAAAEKRLWSPGDQKSSKRGRAAARGAVEAADWGETGLLLGRADLESAI